jgi:hypothetical protein
MATTYLQAVNSVLRRLRESEVSTVNETAYSAMIGELVNDAKSSVEAAYGWNSLSDTLIATTTDGVFSYVLEGSGVRFRVTDVLNTTSHVPMHLVPSHWMNEQFLLSDPSNGSPLYYNFNGVDSNGDTLVDVYPIPDGAYTLNFNVMIPQEALSADSDVIKVPADVVILNAFARAIVERGEDGSLQSSEAYALAKNLMADYIALESNRYLEDSNWVSI